MPETYKPEDLLPHRGDMLFIDSVIDYGEDWIECNIIAEPPLTLRDRQGRVPAWFGIEYMSQTAAALEGLRALQRHDVIRTSFIIGAKHVQASEGYFTYEQKLRAKVTVYLRDDTGVGVYTCSLYDGEREVMSAQIKGAMPEDDQVIYDRVR